MEFIPHTDLDVEQMLKSIGKENISELFKDIPAKIIFKKGLHIPSGLSEIELKKLVWDIGSKNKVDFSYFVGAGAYRHFIPSVVNHVISKSEFYTAYTPYQPEISQGVLQAIYEYQTMICNLTGMESSNASMYDGASALAESCIMACNITKRNKIALSKAVHPHYREVVKTYCKAHEIALLEIDHTDGLTVIDKVESDVAALIVQSPNFFGAIEDVAALSKAAHDSGALLNACVIDGTSLGVLKNPGSLGADIFIGEGQSFGNSINFGGPYLGILATKKEYVRQLPGRIVGKTVDKDGKEGFILTLQAREQHIRREKAPSNICSNQALNMLAAAVFLSSAGKAGLKEIARQNVQKAHYLADSLKKAGAEIMLNAQFYNEFVAKFSDASAVHAKLVDKGILGGILLGEYYPELSNCILFCATEMNTMEEIDNLAEALK